MLHPPSAPFQAYLLFWWEIIPARCLSSLLHLLRHQKMKGSTLARQSESWVDWHLLLDVGDQRVGVAIQQLEVLLVPAVSRPHMYQDLHHAATTG